MLHGEISLGNIYSFRQCITIILPQTSIMSIWLKERFLIPLFLAKDEDVMFHHKERNEFHNASIDEFQGEVLNLIHQGLEFILVLPRSYGEVKFKLMLLNHPTMELSPCKVAFNCSRVFCGYSFLVKDICWGCKSKVVSACCCACHIAMYCSRDCQKVHFPKHKKFCKVVRASPPRIADGSENLEMKQV